MDRQRVKRLCEAIIEIADEVRIEGGDDAEIYDAAGKIIDWAEETIALSEPDDGTLADVGRWLAARQGV